MRKPQNLDTLPTREGMRDRIKCRKMRDTEKSHRRKRH